MQYIRNPLKRYIDIQKCSLYKVAHVVIIVDMALATVSEVSSSHWWL